LGRELDGDFFAAALLISTIGRLSQPVQSSAALARGDFCAGCLFGCPRDRTQQSIPWHRYAVTECTLPDAICSTQWSGASGLAGPENVLSSDSNREAMYS